MSGHVLKMHVIYDHPADQPDWVVVREWFVVEGQPQPLPGAFSLHVSVNAARDELIDKGLIMIPRDPEDDPCIVESWV